MSFSCSYSLKHHDCASAPPSGLSLTWAGSPFSCRCSILHRPPSKSISRDHLWAPTLPCAKEKQANSTNHAEKSNATGSGDSCGPPSDLINLQDFREVWRIHEQKVVGACMTLRTPTGIPRLSLLTHPPGHKVQCSFSSLTKSNSLSFAHFSYSPDCRKRLSLFW